MTGHQPHPGTGFSGGGEKTKPILIEEIAKAAGADFVETINVYNSKESVAKIKDLYNKKGVSVIVAKGECVLFKKKQAAKEKNE